MSNLSCVASETWKAGPALVFENLHFKLANTINNLRYTYSCTSAVCI